MGGFLIVFLGGGLGAAARHGVNLLSTHLVGTTYPWGTFFINVLGSLLIGACTEWLALYAHLTTNLRLFLVTGILGGFTTFSTFSLEVGLLHERGASLADDELFAASERTLRSVLPALPAGRVVAREARREWCSPDGLQVIRRMAYDADVYVAAGWSGHGFATAPAVGPALARWMTSGFRPDVLTPFAWPRG